MSRWLACARSSARNRRCNCPYEFFLVGGAKMSSRKGIGVTSRDMANFLPPDILRFLHDPPDSAPARELRAIRGLHHQTLQRVRPLPSRDISTTRRSPPTTSAFTNCRRSISEPAHWLADFQLVAALSQMPHLDMVKELEKPQGLAVHRSGAQASRAAHPRREILGGELRQRRGEDAAAGDAARARAGTQPDATRLSSNILAEKLPERPHGTATRLQVCIFNAARLTPIDQPAAFKAIYRVLLDRENGPKAGNFLSFLDRKFVEQRVPRTPGRQGRRSGTSRRSTMPPCNNGSARNGRTSVPSSLDATAPIVPPSSNSSPP